MKLINADKLYPDCMTKDGKLAISQSQLANAPTVPLPDFKEGYKQAIIDGKTNFKKPQGDWISVSERLPEKMGTYLVTLEYKEHGQGITTLWYHGEGIGWDLRVADTVIAWQPLPEPYKKGGAEE